MHDQPEKVVLERRLRAAAQVCLLAILFVCLAVFIRHESPQPWLGGLSKAYVLGAVIPLLGFTASLAAILTFVSSSGRLAAPLGYALLSCWLLVPMLGVNRIPNYELTVVVMSLGVLALVLALHLISRRPAWLLSFLAIALLCLVLLIPEIVATALGQGTSENHRLPRWGDRMTFSSIFPEKEPFISPGGRLLPNLDIDVYTDIPGRGPYRIRTNSIGLRNDREIPLRAEPGELRILSLGDSFSGGYGVNQDEFLGPILESRWDRHFPDRWVTVINAEISDPAYGLLYLQRYGVNYSPNYIFFSYVDNDLHQNYLPFEARKIFSLDREGKVITQSIDPQEDRNRKAVAQAHYSQYIYPKASLVRNDSLARKAIDNWLYKLRGDFLEFRILRPLAEGLPSPVRGPEIGETTLIDYREESHSSGHLRLVDFATNMATLYKDGDKMTADLYSTLFDVLKAYQQTARGIDATFVFIYYPRRWQVQPQDWKLFQEFWNLDPNDFDLDLEAATLRAFCDSKNIPFIDTTTALREAAVHENVFMANDLHVNALGQLVSAKAVADFIERRWPRGEHPRGHRANATGE